MARPKQAAKSGRQKTGRHKAKAAISYAPWLLRRLGNATAPAVPLLAVGALVAGSGAAAATGMQGALADGKSVTSALAPSGRVDLSLRAERAAGRSSDRSALPVRRALANRPTAESSTQLDPTGAAAEPGSAAGKYGLGEAAILVALEGQRDVRARTNRVEERVEVAHQRAEARERAARAAREAREAREAAERRREERMARTWHAPLSGYSISARFGEAGGYWSSGYHTGLDLSASSGTPIRSVGPGEIVEAGWAGAYGQQIKVRHSDGTETWYCHMSAFEQTSGSVGGGEVIGYVGSTGNSTGPHLHLEVRPGGGDPIDPYGWLADRGVAL